MRAVAAIGFGFMVVALIAFEATRGDFQGGFAAGMFAGAAVYDLSAGFLAYFVPFWIALSRSHPETPAIGAINLFLGWTVIGWLVAMLWALSHVPDESPGESSPLVRR